MIFAAIADWSDAKSYPVDFMCRELGVSRSGFYKWRAAEPSQRSKDDCVLILIMKEVFKKSRGNPGVRRMRAGMTALGFKMSTSKVHRLMKAAGLQGRHPKAWKKTTIQGKKPVDAPDRIGRDFTAARANEKWCGDITYVKTWEGWAYTATVIDLHSREIVGYAVDNHMRTSLVTEALDMALASRKPSSEVIFHSDRGTQYTSHDFAEYCKKNSILRSLGKTGICYDNAVSESTFATYKKELIHTRPWSDVDELREETIDWIENYFNTVRRHSTLEYLTPREYALGFRNINQLAA